jgi:hypothetical protein
MLSRAIFVVLVLLVWRVIENNVSVVKSLEKTVGAA